MASVVLWLHTLGVKGIPAILTETSNNLIIHTGKILDRDYRHTAQANGLVIDNVHGDDLSKFPIEKARLKSIFYPIIVGAIATVGYGWSLESKTVCACLTLWCGTK